MKVSAGAQFPRPTLGLTRLFTYAHGQCLTTQRGSAVVKRKETIKPPTKKELTDASKELKKGHSAGGRILAEASVAKRQGVKSGKKK
jgi:hypothetical protein